jgi:hypothetical protein
MMGVGAGSGSDVPSLSIGNNQDSSFGGKSGRLDADIETWSAPPFVMGHLDLDGWHKATGNVDDRFPPVEKGGGSSIGKWGGKQFGVGVESEEDRGLGSRDGSFDPVGEGESAGRKSKGKILKCSGTMADAVFFFASRFGKGFLELRAVKKRVVSEATRAARFSQNNSFVGSADRGVNRSVCSCQDEGTTKTSGSLFVRCVLELYE